MFFEIFKTISEIGGTTCMLTIKEELANIIGDAQPVSDYSKKYITGSF